MAKLTTEEFIARAQAVHGDRYDYSKVKYVNNQTKVCIICKEHGEFWQKPKNHLSGNGCVICSKENTSKKLKLWTHEKCYEEAQKYRSRSQLKKHCPAAYRTSLKNGWLNDYTWFEVLWEKKWTYETCLLESKKYSSRGEFSEKSPVAWKVSKENGWLEDFDWLISKKRENGYWNRETCYNFAKECTCSSEMNKKNASAYNAARENGWLHEYTWFKTPSLTSIDNKTRSYCIYVYEDKHSKVCYVGLSKNWKQRHSSHKRIRNGKSDIVKQYFDSKGVDIPMPIIIESGLTSEESQIKEDYWKNEYIKRGWKTLNRGATGKNRSSLGGGFIKWDYNACYIEALKYTSISDFQRHNSSAQRAARANGWQNDYYWFEKPEAHNKKWNYESCKIEAMKYASRGEFSEQSPVAWRVSKENGWLEDFDWLKPKKHSDGYWTYSRCYNEAKKYKKLIDFQKDSAVAYGVARKKKWLKDYSWLIRNSSWTYEKCKNEAQKYDKRSHFKEGAPSAYVRSRINGWLDDFFPPKK